MIYVYIDVDGVLADFESAISSYDVDINDFESVVNIMQTDAFFYKMNNLPGIDNFKLLFDTYKDCKDIKIRFLTAIGTSMHVSVNPHLLPDLLDNISEDKRSWLHEYFNCKQDDIIIVDDAADKLKYCNNNHDILIDDYYKTIKQWNEKGGIGLFYPSRGLNVKKIQALSEINTNLINNLIIAYRGKHA